MKFAILVNIYAEYIKKLAKNGRFLSFLVGVLSNELITISVN